MPSAVLEDALARVYRTLAHVPRPREFEASPSRDAEEILRALSAAPLRELTEEQLGPYAGWALTTVGSERDYRHFLPRILELAVQNPRGLGTFPQVIADKLRLCQWERWPTDERDALLDVFDAAFRWALTLHPNQGMDAASWLCGWALLDGSVEPLLLAWRRSTTPNAVLQLASFAALDADELTANRATSDAFWDDVAPSSRQRIGDWIRGIETREQLRSALEFVAADDTWQIEQALRVLDPGV